MKKIGVGIAAALAVSFVLALSPARAAPYQEVHGSVLVPIPGRVGPFVVEGCPGGVLGGTLGWAARASIRYRFPVSSSTWGMPFTVTPYSRVANIDINFQTQSSSIGYESSAFGGEHGVVPHGSLEAAVCLSFGAPTKFTYRAGPGV